MNDQLKTLGVKDIATMLHKTVETVQEDARRRPQCLPPRLVIPDSKKLLWIESDVIAWLDKCRTDEKRTVGRPRR